MHCLALSLRVAYVGRMRLTACTSYSRKVLGFWPI